MLSFKICIVLDLDPNYMLTNKSKSIRCVNPKTNIRKIEVTLSLKYHLLVKVEKDLVMKSKLGTICWMWAKV